MRLCCFGDYDRDYHRTRVLLNGLAALGVEVAHCNVRSDGFSRFVKLIRELRALRGQYDLIYIPMSNSRIFPVLAKLFFGKPVVWEPLFSIYDNWIFDRKLAKPISLKALYYWVLDKLGCTFSDLVVLDTYSNIDYFIKTFHVAPYKFVRALGGADESIFYPRERTRKDDVFIIEFHGAYIPVQGTEVIIKAAKLLDGEKAHFVMIGSGQEGKRIRALAEELELTNMTFHPFLPQSEVVEHIRSADVCMGLIGDVPRVVRAIPNKLYEAAAMARVSINADTSALREVFTPGVDTIGIKAGAPEDLARVIRELMANGKAEEMGKKARETFLARSNSQLIASALHADLERLLQRS